MNYTYVPLPLVEEASSVSASAQVLVIDDGEVKRTDAANIGIKPTGKLTLTNTTETDCANYAAVQIVDANLLAENIKKDVSVLGITGSYEGGGSSDFSYMTETTATLNTGDHNSFTLGVSWADIMAGTTVYYFVADAAFVSHMNAGTAGHCIAVILATDSDGYYAQAHDLSVSNYTTVFQSTYEGSDTTQHPTFELFD